MERNRKLSALLGLAATLATAGVASAQTQVNASGATLFQDFFKAAANTNDFIDVDGDGIAGIYGVDGLGNFASGPLAGQPYQVENLAPALTITPAPGYSATTNGGEWVFTYRAVGSGNGWAEMRDSQLVRIANTDGNPATVALTPGLPTSIPADQGITNTTTWSLLGINNANANPVAPGTPIPQTSVDIGVMDVPTIQFVKQSGTPTPTAQPGTAGYGANAAKTALNQSNGLKTLDNTSVATGISLNTNIGSPDANTVFDTVTAWSPIGAIANPGTGKTQISFDELKHLEVTGRMPSGENLVAVVRDAGSGTRNGFQTSIGIDPSWGDGEGYSPKNANNFDFNFDGAGENNILGPDYLPDAKGGSGHLEDTLQNTRLAIGHTGLLGGSRAGVDSASHKYDVLSVSKDGVNYVTPSATSLVNNGNVATGYQIGGSQTFATVGDPTETNPASPTYMANQAAAAYISNLTGSYQNFIDNGFIGADDLGMPSEFLVTTFLLPQGVDAVGDVDDPTSYNPAPGFSAALQAQTLLNFSYSQGVAGDNGGRTPTRSTSTVYTDGESSQYKTIGGTTLAYGVNYITLSAAIQAANDISGDFDGDDDRDAADVGLMVDLIENYSGGWVATAGVSNDVAPDLQGDFNGDGNMDADDVRYFADGLVIVAGKLDRSAGFTAVDNAATSGNFFGTTLSTGEAYAAGDSKADIAGLSTLVTADKASAGVFDGIANLSVNVGTVPGFAPTGSDGIVNATDVNYVYDNFGDFSVLAEAAVMDLSADMNGDLIVDIDDVKAVVNDVLDAIAGDANLDGAVDVLDLSLLATNYGSSNGRFTQGDYNFDGVVDVLDLSLLATNYGQIGTATGAVAIPEPASLALLALGGLALIRRR